MRWRVHARSPVNGRTSIRGLGGGSYISFRREACRPSFLERARAGSVGPGGDEAAIRG